MKPIPETESQYTAYLCSRIPNNECEICSHFLPEFVRQTSPVRHPNAFGFSAPTHCPSCSRGCDRVFLSSSMELPKRVPADFPLKFPDDVISGMVNMNFLNKEEVLNWTERDRLEFAKKVVPKIPRKDFDFTKKAEQLEARFVARQSGNPRKIQEITKEEDFQMPENIGRPLKRKISFKL